MFYKLVVETIVLFDPEDELEVKFIAPVSLAT